MNTLSDLTKDTFDNLGFQEILNIINNNAKETLTYTLTPKETEALPIEQKISISSLKINNRDNSYLQNSVNSIVGTLDIADDALLNSILAYSIYTDNLWILTDIQKNISEMTTHTNEAKRNAEAFYNLKTWLFIKEGFQVVNSNEFFLPAQGQFKTIYGNLVNYTYKEGHYNSFDGLSHACILKSKKFNGNGNILHVTFRGTEFSKLSHYILNAYADMDAYFETFSPFTKAIQDYINNPENNITEVQVAGHSLGGAMVQKFLSMNPCEQTLPKIQGYTFGSPGSKKHLFIKFLNIGYHFMKNHTLNWEAPILNDERLHEFYHSNDPIPKIGLLGYQRTGIVHNLFDQVYEQSKNSNSQHNIVFNKFPAFNKIITYFQENFINRFKVSFHSSKLYTLNIAALIDKHYQTYPHLTEKINQQTYYSQNYRSLDAKLNIYKQLNDNTIQATKVIEDKTLSSIQNNNLSILGYNIERINEVRKKLANIAHEKIQIPTLKL